MMTDGLEVRGDETKVSIVLREVEWRWDVCLVAAEGVRVMMVAGRVDEYEWRGVLVARRIDGGGEGERDVVRHMYDDF